LFPFTSAAAPPKFATENPLVLCACGIEFVKASPVAIKTALFAVVFVGL